jgi:hypothetical protein
MSRRGEKLKHGSESYLSTPSSPRRPSKMSFLTPMETHLMVGFKYLFSEETPTLIQNKKESDTYIENLKVRMTKETDLDIIALHTHSIACSTRANTMRDFILAYRNSAPYKKRMTHISRLTKELNLPKLRTDAMKAEAQKNSTQEAWEQWVAHRMALPSAPKV